MSDDLADRLLAAIENRDQNRWRVHDQECDFGSHTTDLTELATPSAVCDCLEPENIRRRCAADRKTIELHYDPDTEGEAGEYFAVICPSCRHPDRPDEPVRHPCPTLQALAEGYGLT